MAAKKFITTKYGTKIDVTGLSPEQVAKVKSTAEDKGAYGAKGAAMAKSFQTKNASATNGGAATTPTTTTPQTPGQNLSGNPLGIDAKTGTIDPTKATETIGNAETQDFQSNFDANNPGSQTDAYGNTQEIVKDPVTGKVTIKQTGGNAFNTSQDAFLGAMGNVRNMGQLNLSDEKNKLQANGMDLSGDINNYRQNGELDLSGDINNLKSKGMNLSGDINSYRNTGKLDLSGDINNLKSKGLDLSGNINDFKQKGNLDLSGDISGLQGRAPLSFEEQQQQIREGKLNLDGSPKILQTGDVRGDAQNAADANYNYITKDYAKRKKQEMEEAKQELANRGIPLDPSPDSLYGRTLAEINNRYQGLDDQAKNQAITQSNQTLSTYADVQGKARNAFVDSATQQHTAGLQDVSTSSSLKGQQEAAALDKFGAVTSAKGQQTQAQRDYFNSLNEAEKAQYNANLAEFDATTGAKTQQNAADNNFFNSLTEAQKAQYDANLKEFGAVTGAKGQESAAQKAFLDTLTGAQKAQYDANLQEFGAITGAKTAEHNSVINDATNLGNITNSFNPNFTPYQGAQTDQSGNLNTVLNTIAGFDAQKYATDKDYKAKMDAIAASKRPSGGGSRSSGSDAGFIIAGEAP